MTGPQDEFSAELAGEPETHFAELYEGDPPSRIIADGANDVVALVDIAPLAVGHLLAIPRRDFPSFAALDPATWNAWRSLRASLMDTMERLWTRPTAFEHGSSVAMRGSACITHAHLHLVPGDLELRSRLAADGLDLHPVGDQRDIAAAIGAARPYFYVEGPDGAAFVAAADVPLRPSQYLRRQAAEALKLSPDEWDWAISVRRDRLRQTVSALMQGPVL
jgi:diadenosine tetraphosphate (Ap4A) HIT family hydrolase